MKYFGVLMATKDNTVKFKNKKSFNIGIAFFAVVFVYIVIYVILSFNNETITGYQVKKGSLSQNKQFTGIALRDENIVTSDNSGYINFFVSEGQRASFGDIVYCIDQSGKFSDLLGKDPTEYNALDDSELFSIKQEIKLFSKNFSSSFFSDSYSFDNRMVMELNQLQNKRILNDVNEIEATNKNDIISYSKAKYPGIVCYTYDGFENKTPNDLSVSDFSRENYNPKYLTNDDLVEAGSFAYKYTFNENWSIAILVNNDEIRLFEDGDYIKVKFMENQTTSWGKVKVCNNLGDKTIVDLSFTNSMVSFAGDRFIQIELLLEDDTGLKVPNSAIAERSFFVVDKSFYEEGTTNKAKGFYKKEYTEQGETTRFIEATIYKETEDEVYVDQSLFNYGDVLIKLDSAIGTNELNTFTVSKMGTLIGVYNINKGYADFKMIDVLYSNDEYSIVKANDTYGLNAYDYIALDATVVSDNDFVY